MNFKSFLVSKGITEETFKSMDVEATAGLYNEYNSLLGKKIDELEANNATKSEMTTALDELKNAQLEQMKQMNEALKEMGLKIEASTEKSGTSKGDSLEEVVAKNKEAIAQLKTDRSAPWVKMTVKAVQC